MSNHVRPFSKWRRRDNSFRSSGLVIMTLKKHENCELQCPSCSGQKWSGIVIDSSDNEEHGTIVFTVRRDWCVADSDMFIEVKDGESEQGE